MTPEPALPGGVRLRSAGLGDAALLRDIERAANLVALAHVFPPAEHAFPDREVEQRWAVTLREDGVVVRLAVDDTGRAVGLLAHDEDRVRHLAVVPGWWGRGLGAALLAAATAGVRARGGSPRLWCLELNVRARGLYERRGWRASGVTRAAEWPPHPTEVELVLPDPGPGPGPDPGPACGVAGLAGSAP